MWQFFLFYTIGIHSCCHFKRDVTHETTIVASFQLFHFQLFHGFFVCVSFAVYVWYATASVWARCEGVALLLFLLPMFCNSYFVICHRSNFLVMYVTISTIQWFTCKIILFIYSFEGSSQMIRLFVYAICWGNQNIHFSLLLFSYPLFYIISNTIPIRSPLFGVLKTVAVYVDVRRSRQISSV